jgi:hypothetical protein
MASKRIMDRDQLVGYDMQKKQLIITVSDHMAQKLKADGWQVSHDEQVGHFIQVGLEES